MYITVPLCLDLKFARFADHLTLLTMMQPMQQERKEIIQPIIGCDGNNNVQLDSCSIMLPIYWHLQTA